MCSYLGPLARNELEKAMMGRGIDYETIQLVLRDFDARVAHLKTLCGGPTWHGEEPYEDYMK